MSLSNYNASGQAQTVTDNAGSRTLTYGYDASGNLTSFADAGVAAHISGDAATSYSYSGSHQLSKIVDPAGRITKIAYVGSTGQVASVTSGYGTPAETTTLLTYYPVGDSHCTTQPSYACTTVEQDRANATPNPVAGTYEKSTYYTDKSGRVTFAYDPAGHKQAKTWDVNSNQTSLSDKMSTPNVTTATYAGSGNNNPLTLKDPTGMTDTLAYTGSGHPYQPDTQNLPNNAANPSSTQIAYTYAAVGASTAYGDVTKTTQGTTTRQFSYQGDGSTSCGAKPGQVCTTTNAKNGVTSFGYDSVGNVTTVTPPSPLGGITLTPDAVGRDTYSVDGKGQQTQVSYDALDRVSVVRYPAYSKTITYTYDGDGNTSTEVVTAPATPTATYTFSYDALNRLTDKTLPANNTTVTDDAYSYDLLGNLTQLKETGGSGSSAVSLTTSYSWDNTNLLTQLVANTSAPNGTTTATIGFVNDNNGRRTETDYGASGTVKQTISYDNAGREVTVGAKQGATVLTSYTYCYVNPIADCPTTPTGPPLAGGIETRLKQRTIQNDPGASSTLVYTYDALSRLTDANTTAGGTDHRSYGYDADGNRTSHTVNGTNTTYTYNTADQATSTGYTYDADGNATTIPGVSNLTANELNQTTSITKSGTTTSFAYAGAGQDTRTTADNVDAALSALGTDVEYRSANGHAFYIRDPNGNLITVNNAAAGGVRDVLDDGQGSVVALAQYGTGAIADRYSYDPYGQTLTHTGTSFNPWQYAAGYRDSATGLYHFGARYYNPADGRFTQQDPSGQETNLYAYAADNPLNQFDPTGRDAGQAAGALAGAFTIGTGAEIAGASGAVAAGVGLGAGILTGGIGLGIVAIGIGISSLFSLF